MHYSEYDTKFGSRAQSPANSLAEEAKDYKGRGVSWRGFRQVRISLCLPKLVVDYLCCAWVGCRGHDTGIVPVCCADDGEWLELPEWQGFEKWLRWSEEVDGMNVRY